MPPLEIIKTRGYTSADKNIIEELSYQDIFIEELPAPYDRQFLDWCKEFDSTLSEENRNKFFNKLILAPFLYYCFKEYLVNRGKIKTPWSRKMSNVLKRLVSSSIPSNSDAVSLLRLQKEARPLGRDAISFIWGNIDGYITGIEDQVGAE